MREERQNPVYFDNPAYYNCEYTVGKSLGATFTWSLHIDKDGNHVQGRIHIWGGSKQQWFEGTEVSYLRCPEVFAGIINLELINQLQNPGQGPLFQALLFRQAVWCCMPIGALGGYRLEYDSEPYNIITQCFTTYQYVLMDSNGQVFPHLVPPEQLEPVQMTWIAA